MRRVRIIYRLKRLASPVVIKTEALVVCVASCLFLISVADVIRNMPPVSDVGALFAFHLSAFLNTEVPIQILLLSILTLFSFIVKDVIVSVRKRGLRTLVT